MTLSLLLTVHALADSLVLRADNLLCDSTVAQIAPHGEYGGLITIMWVAAVVVVLVAGGIIYGLYSWLK